MFHHSRPQKSLIFQLYMALPTVCDSLTWSSFLKHGVSKDSESASETSCVKNIRRWTQSTKRRLCWWVDGFKRSREFLLEIRNMESSCEGLREDGRIILKNNNLVQCKMKWCGRKALLRLRTEPSGNLLYAWSLTFRLQNNRESVVQLRSRHFFQAVHHAIT